MSTQDPFQPQSTGWNQPPAYGQPPADPYAQPAYGTPAPSYGAPAYGAPAYGAPEYGTPTYGAPAYGAPAYVSAPAYSTPAYAVQGFGYPSTSFGVAPTYAHWGLRVGAMLLDLLTTIPYYVGAFVSGFLSTPGYDQFGQPTTVDTPAGLAALAIGALVSLGLWVWNRGIRQARTGQSWGKKVLGLRLANEATGENVGIGRALLRDLTHWLDCWILGLGFWFPLWDAKRQTFADKICKTVSVR